MGMPIKIENLTFGVHKKKHILHQLSLDISPGEFVAILGENGAGKTTFLDLLMGFRVPNSGTIQVDGCHPHLDHWQARHHISYLSEKIDIPGDWSVRDFLDFNKFFYRDYNVDSEKKFLNLFSVIPENRLGNMSAGEVRRAQIVAGLSSTPKLIIVDEITAVLDIVGRRKFMQALKELNQTIGCTIILATNILENLEDYISHLLVLQKGRQRLHKPLEEFLDGQDKMKFPQKVADVLEQV